MYGEIESLSGDQLKQIKDAADKLTEDSYRVYIPGKMLAMLLEKFRDDVTAVLGQEMPVRRMRPGSTRKPTLDELTTRELRELTHLVLTLLTYAGVMDDPALPELLREFRESLINQARERSQAQAEIAQRAKAQTQSC